MKDISSTDHDVDFRLLFEASPDLYLVLNTQLKIVAVSDAYARATMTRREEILGKTMFQIFPDNPDDPTAEGQRNLRASLQQVLLSGKPDTMPVQKYDIPRPDGKGFEERYWSPINIPILGKDGCIVYILHRAEDLTEFIRVKQQGVEQSQLNETLRNQAVKMEVELFARSKEIASASAELKAANEELTRLYAKTLELDELKTRFFANVSHEFRTPLTLMLGPLEELLARFAPNNAKPAADDYEQLKLVQRNSLRLLKLVNSLLDFSRIEAGRVDAVYQATDLSTYTTELTSLFRSAIDKAGLRLVVNCPALPEPVYVDRCMWEKIIINMLSNAYKHTFAGEIEVALRWKGQYVELMVRDTGVGIAADQLSNVFDRFHRVPSVRSRSHEGSGIGLALVKEQVHLHGGKISVTSQPGVGSTFIVNIPIGTAHLPAEHIQSCETPLTPPTAAQFFSDEMLHWAEAPEQNGEADQQSATDIARLSGTNARIVLADDNTDMRRYVARLLREQGYEFTAVADGDGVLAALQQQLYDLVLTDIMMPGLDGISLLNILRENPNTQTIPVILLSARAGEDERIEGLKHRADDYLTKPFSARELLAHVGACLGISRLRTEVESQLRIQEAEREFRSLAETMPQMVWATRPDGWNIYHNQRWVEYTGLTVEESYGHAWISVLHPDDRPSAWEAWQRATQHLDSYSIECRMQRADGIYRWWLIRGVPLLNEKGQIEKWYGTCTDIQDLKEADIAIRESEARLHFALAMCNTGAWEVELETGEVYRSIEYARIFGYADTESVWSAERFMEHVLDEDRPQVSALLEEAFHSGGEKQFECRIRRTDGEILWIRVAGRFRVTRTDGKNQVAVGIVQDITESKHAQEELRQHRDQLETLVASRTVELETARLQADAANRSKSAFLANMSHEIRTPMNAVLGFCYLLEQRQLDDESLGLVRKVHNAGRTLLSLINDVLDFSKIEAGRLEIEHAPFKLTELLNNLASLTTQTALDKGLALIITCPAEVDTLIGDALRIQQILLNLLSNAIKFTEHGEVELRIDINALAMQQIELRFSVRDTGIGISSEQQALIFSAFGQADSSISRRFGGSGLGLNISMQLVEMMGGRLQVDSEMGRGSEFWFVLPLQRDEKSVSPDKESIASLLSTTFTTDSVEVGQRASYQPALVSDDTSKQRIPGIRILVVDDSEINRDVAKGILEADGAIVHLACDGQDALEWLQAHPDSVDIVLMDVQMPRMDGYTATRRIREDSLCSELPIVALTAGAFQELRAAAQDAGMNDFIAKPFNVAQMMETIQRLTGIGLSEMTKTGIGSPVVSDPISSDVENVPDLPGIDLPGALEQWGENAVYRVYLDKFVAAYAQYAASIAAICQQGDLQQAASLAHKLYGVAGTLRLPQVAELARELEKRLKAGDAALNLANDLQTAIDQVCRTAEVLRQIAGPGYPPVSVSQNAQDDLRTLCKRLMVALDRHDPDESALQLSGLRDHLDPVQLAELETLLTDFDFRGAEAAARSLLMRLNIPFME